jgi:hypothetical protein
MTRLLIPTLHTLGCTAPVAAQTAAQASSHVRPGAEVRVTSPSASGRFVVQEMDSGILTLRDSSGAAVRVPLASVTMLSVSRGRRSAGAGALRGAGLGFAGGAVAGIILGYVAGDDPPEDLWFAYSAEDKALIYGVLLGVGSGLVGTVVGLASPGEQWESVPLERVRAGMASDGGLAVAYSIRF